VRRSRALVPALAGLVGLAGSLLATLFLYRAAAGAIDRVLEERLRGAAGPARSCSRAPVRPPRTSAR